MARKAPPARTPQPRTVPRFTLADADIVSQRAVPRVRLPGVLGAGAAARAFGKAAPSGDHDSATDGAANPGRQSGRPAQPSRAGDGD